MVLDSSLTMLESDAVDVASPPSATARITKEGIAALHNYFEARRWPRNAKMPKVNTDGMLDRIIHRFGLKRSQASRQLRAWKLIKYDNAQVEIVLNPEDIEISIMEGISMELEEYVAFFFATIHEGHEVPDCVDATNYCLSIKTLHKADAKSWLVKYIHNNPTHEFTAIFVHLLKRWASLAAESFPKCAKNMSDDELDFSVAVKQVQIICLNEQWKPLYSTITFPPSTGLDEEQFLYFFLWLSNGLFFLWSRSMADDERRAIQIPDEDLVAKYSLPVVYYVAGWTLQCTSLALLVGENDRFKYQSFANNHKLTTQSAKDASLPCDLKN